MTLRIVEIARPIVTTRHRAGHASMARVSAQPVGFTTRVRASAWIQVQVQHVVRPMQILVRIVTTFYMLLSHSVMLQAAVLCTRVKLITFPWVVLA